MQIYYIYTRDAYLVGDFQQNRLIRLKFVYVRYSANGFLLYRPHKTIMFVICLKTHEYEAKQKNESFANLQISTENALVEVCTFKCMYMTYYES